MKNNDMLSVRIDSDLKKEVDALFKDMGMDTSTAIRVFLIQCKLRKEIPFRIALPYTYELPKAK